MERRSRFAIAAVALVLALAVGAAAYLAWFAPEASTTVDEPLPDLGHGMSDEAGGPGDGPAGAASGPVPLRSGTFRGADEFHFARGTVALHQAANGTYLLRFEGYDAREGPDVYLYLTREAGDGNAAEVEGEGLRLRVPGGEEDGRATVRGSFNVFLPEGTDALAYHGVTIWCDQFDHFFGHAPLA
jgi:hypothetical protein